MSEQISIALEILIKAMETSEEYQNYQKARMEIAGQKEKAEQLNLFRKERYQVFGQADGGYEKMDSLLQWEQEIRKDPECREFLKRENEICREMRKIVQKILNLADFTIPLTEEGEDTNGITEA